MNFKFKWFLVILAVAVTIAGSVFVFIPRVTVHGEGTLAISVTTSDIPQFDIAKISDIPAYGVIEKSGCGEFKGKVKIRIDCFLKPESPYYDQYGGAYVVDTTSQKYLDGYPGKVDEKTGEPLNWEDYNKWWDGLPTVWQENPFHSHFVYYDTTVLDDAIKSKLAEVTEYFYAFHTYCWENDYTFLSQWVKVPKVAGSIRDVFIAGDSSPPNKTACEDKAIDIADRASEFDTSTFEQEPSPEPPLNIGDKGTIDVGSPAIDRGSYRVARTHINIDNPANASGTIDTVKTWFSSAVFQNGTDFKPGTFFLVSGTTYECRDSEAIGAVTKGSEQTFSGLTITVETGDLLGEYHSDGGIERDTSGYSGVLWANTDDGDYATPSTQTTYSTFTGDTLSLYGTGTESGGGFDIGNAPESEDLGILEVNTTYYAYGSAPSNPVEDGECTFTVTNNGDACDLDMKVSDFTGGVGWNIDPTPAGDEAKITAYYSGQNPASGLVLANTDAEFYDGLASSATIKWDFALLTGSSFSDGVEKTAVITITAVAED
jgi:hypothetical protein